jgi:hypothetical protein
MKCYIQINNRTWVYYFAVGTGQHNTVWWLSHSVRATKPVILPSPGLLRAVRWFEANVSGLYIAPIIKDILTVEDETDGSSGTSASNYFTPRNNPEDGRIRLQPRRTPTLSHKSVLSVLCWYLTVSKVWRDSPCEVTLSLFLALAARFLSHIEIDMV